MRLQMKTKNNVGSFGTNSVKCQSIIEIGSRSVSIARYDNVKRYENNELVETADHSMFGNDSKLNERPPQRMCFEWSSEQNSSNKIWENVLSIKKQKSGHQPLGIQKTKVILTINNVLCLNKITLFLNSRNY